MKYLKIIACLIGITSLHLVGTVGDQVTQYSSVLGTFCPLLSDTVKEGAKPGAKSAQAKCKTMVKVGMEAGSVANDVEKFKDKDLALVTKKGEELITRLKCMDRSK